MAKDVRAPSTPEREILGKKGFVFVSRSGKIQIQNEVNDIW